MANSEISKYDYEEIIILFRAKLGIQNLQKAKLKQSAIKQLTSHTSQQEDKLGSTYSDTVSKSDILGNTSSDTVCKSDILGNTSSDTVCKSDGFGNTSSTTISKSDNRMKLRHVFPFTKGLSGEEQKVDKLLGRKNELNGEEYAIDRPSLKNKNKINGKEQGMDKLLLKCKNKLNDEKHRVDSGSGVKTRSKLDYEKPKVDKPPYRKKKRNNELIDEEYAMDRPSLKNKKKLNGEEHGIDKPLLKTKCKFDSGRHEMDKPAHKNKKKRNDKKHEVDKPIIRRTSNLLRISDLYEFLGNLSVTSKSIEEDKESKKLKQKTAKIEQEGKVSVKVNPAQLVQPTEQSQKTNIYSFINEVRNNLCVLNSSSDDTIQLNDIVINLRDEFLTYQRSSGAGINVKKYEQPFQNLSTAKQCLPSTMREKFSKHSKHKKSKKFSKMLPKTKNYRTHECKETDNYRFNQAHNETTSDANQTIHEERKRRKQLRKVFTEQALKNVSKIKSHQNYGVSQTTTSEESEVGVKKHEYERVKYYDDSDDVSTHTEKNVQVLCSEEDRDSSTQSEKVILKNNYNNRKNSPNTINSLKYLAEIGLEEYLKRQRNVQILSEINEQISEAYDFYSEQESNMDDDSKMKEIFCTTKVDCHAQTSISSIFPKLLKKYKRTTPSSQMSSLANIRRMTAETLSYRRNNKMNLCMKLMEYPSTSETESDYSFQSIESNESVNSMVGFKYTKWEKKKLTDIKLCSKEVQTAQTHSHLYLSIDEECERCRNGIRPIYRKHVVSIISYIIRGYKRDDIALIINFTRNKTFHFKVISLNNGQLINCFFTTPKALQVARNEDIMKYFLVYFKQ